MSIEARRGEHEEITAIREQLEYYRARAAEYEQWWLRQGRYDRGEDLNAQWLAEAAEVAVRPCVVPAGAVACSSSPAVPVFGASSCCPLLRGWQRSTGRRRCWRLQQRGCARRVSTSSRRTSSTGKPLGSSTPSSSDSGFRTCRPERFAGFWELIAGCLAPGGRVFFVDSRRDLDLDRA